MTLLALDLGGTHLRTAVVDSDGRVYARRQAQAGVNNGANGVFERCVDALRASMDEHGRSGGIRPEALIVSSPGPLDPLRGVLIDPPNLHPSLRDFPLAERLSEVLGLPCHMERDTVVAALAEGHFGAAQGLSDYIYLTISTGIGGAIVTGGRLMLGPDGMAGELGHLTIEMDGPPCGCGASGHLEALASGSGIARSAARALAAGERAPALEEIARRISPQPLAAIHVAQAEEEGDELAARIMERARQAVAAAMVSIVDIFTPLMVVVGGGLADGQGERLLGPAREAVARSAFRIAASRVRIVPAALGDDVGLLGAIPLMTLRGERVGVEVA